MKIKKYYIQIHDSESVIINAEKIKCDDFENLRFYVDKKLIAFVRRWIYWMEVRN